MSVNTRLSALFKDETRTAWSAAFDALMSPDKPDLHECLGLVRQEGDWPEGFRYGLEALQTYRDFYGDRRDLFSSDMRAKIEAYDEAWTSELLDQLHRLRYGMPSE